MNPYTIPFILTNIGQFSDYARPTGHRLHPSQLRSMNVVRPRRSKYLPHVGKRQQAQLATRRAKL